MILLPWGMLLENSACSFVCLCLWENPSALQALGLSGIILFCVKWKTRINIYCAPPSPVSDIFCAPPSPKKGPKFGSHRDHMLQIMGQISLCGVAESFRNLWKSLGQYPVVHEVPQLFEIIISNRVSVLWSPWLFASKPG